MISAALSDVTAESGPIRAARGQPMAISEFRRPRLPPRFHQVGLVGTTLYLMHALAFFLIPAIAAGVVVDSSAPVALRWTLTIVLGVIAGHGMHLLTFVGHEGMHTNLHRNKYISAAFALLWSAPVPFFFIVGYSVTHWKHHRFAGQSCDPDAIIFSKYKNFTSRFFLGRSKGVRIYTKNALRLALGLQMPEGTKLPFSENEMRWLARFNVLLGLGALAGYTLVWRRSPLLCFAVMGVPYISLYVLTCMRAYMEHAGTRPGQFNDSRSYTSPIYTALFFGGNYHLEHHLYPAVPSYRLPALHRHLASLGVFDATGASIEPTFFGAQRYTTSRFQYPCVDLQDTPDDFIESIAEGRLNREALGSAAEAGGVKLDTRAGAAIANES
jgi:fatty acid desaturase